MEVGKQNGTPIATNRRYKIVLVQFVITCDIISNIHDVRMNKEVKENAVC